MAERPRGYGMTAELQEKKDAKYDSKLEQQAREWIEAVLNKQGCLGSGKDAVQESLKDGVMLCELINALSPGSVKKISTSKMAFKMMENIGNFLDSAYAYGVPKLDMFQTVDLYEGANMPQVINGIHALGRKTGAKGFDGPTLGPKEDKGQEREFSEEELRGAGNIIGLQMGSNKGGASQGFGYAGRQISD